MPSYSNSAIIRVIPSAVKAVREIQAVGRKKRDCTEGAGTMDGYGKPVNDGLGSGVLCRSYRFWPSDDETPPLAQSIGREVKSQGNLKRVHLLPERNTS